MEERKEERRLSKKKDKHTERKVVGELRIGQREKGGRKKREQEAMRVPAVITRPFP